MLSLLLGFSLFISQNLYSNLSKTNEIPNTANLKEECKSPSEVYKILIGMKTQFPEGMYWTDASSGLYRWHGGSGSHNEIAIYGTGCVAFCFRLSDAAFGSLPARITYQGGFKMSDVRVGDLLRVEYGKHSVIVLEVYDNVVVVAEGNYKKSIHWGRVLTKAQVEYADHLITRYPKGYVAPEDPEAKKEVANGKFGNGFTWSLLGSGQITISGKGNMPDFQENNAPWKDYVDRINNVVFSSGITGIGAYAIKNSNIYTVTFLDTIKTIGNHAFENCTNMPIVSIPEGCEVIGDSAFASCSALTGVTIPSTIRSVQQMAFAKNNALQRVKFLPGTIPVEIGNALFFECWNLVDITLPTLMDKISDNMFQNCRILMILYIPNGVTTIGKNAFMSSGLLAVVIPNTVKDIEMDVFTGAPKLSDLYYCGTEAQWNDPSFYKGNMLRPMPPIYSPPKIHYVSDITAITVNNDGTDVTSKTVAMKADDTKNFSVQLTFSPGGEVLYDSRHVEWFCVTPDTKTDSMSAIEAATYPSEILDFSVVKDNEKKVATLTVTAHQNGKAKIVGYIPKNPSSSIAKDSDHIFAFFDIKIGDGTTPQPPTKEPSDPTKEPSDPTKEPSDPTKEPTNPMQEDPSHSEQTSKNQYTVIVPSQSASDEGEKKHSPVGVIVGVVVAILVIAGVAIAVFFYFKCRRHQNVDADNDDKQETKFAEDEDDIDKYEI